MKKMISWVLIVVFSLGLIGCGQKSDPKVTLPDKIDKITIARNGGPLTTFSYTDSAKIDKLVDYFTSLELQPTKKDPSQYVGGGWFIAVSAGSETIEMVHFGNLLFKTPAGKWYTISYEQAVEFETILKENVPDELPQNVIYKQWQTN